jgi:hypothetical protein
VLLKERESVFKLLVRGSLKMAFAAANSSKQYADAIYQKFSELVQKRPPDKINKGLYDINFYLEKIIAVMYANHYNSFALFAVVTYCCVHVNFKCFTCEP